MLPSFIDVLSLIYFVYNVHTLIYHLTIHTSTGIHICLIGFPELPGLPDLLGTLAASQV